MKIVEIRTYLERIVTRYWIFKYGKNSQIFKVQDFFYFQLKELFQIATYRFDYIIELLE